MRNWWKLAIGGFLTMSLFLTGCANQAGPVVGEHGKKLKVVTTFYPLYEFSKQIAGSDADISMLIPAGVEPHDWEPTPKDVAQIAQANVFVYNGGGIESWVDSVLKSVDEPNLKAVEAASGIKFRMGTAEQNEFQVRPSDAQAVDPHVWLDPVLAEKEVQNIAMAFESADPKHAKDYKQHANVYLAQLKDLDNLYRTKLQSTKGKDFVTSHAAFGYMAKQYGLTQLPIAGLDPEQEPSAVEMANVVTFAKQHHVTTIFFESLVSPKVAQAVAREVGASTAVLDPLEGLTEEEKAQGLNYIDVMKSNLDALIKALNS